MTTLLVGNNNFYKGDNTYGEWYIPDINTVATNRWVSNPQGPCPTGYSIPTGGTTDTSTEWGKLYTIVNTSLVVGSCNQANIYDRTRCILNLPLPGDRMWNDGTYGNQSTNGWYWSSSPNGIYSYNAMFIVGGGNIASTNYARSFGLSVRCIRH